MATLHPHIVHFTIGLLAVGVLFRLISLLGRPAFVGPAATTLILLGTLAAVGAVQSGTDAHGPVERVPLSRAAVVEHEDWGKRTRNVFFIVAAIELVALALARSPRLRMVQGAAALVGVIGLGCLYEAGEHGGRLVYSYAGGVGIRSGDPNDVGRLLLAGLYHQAQQDRAAGRLDQAAALLAQAASRFPGEAEVLLAAAESVMVDRKDPAGALNALTRITVAPDNRVLRLRRANLQADALEATGQKDAALAVLQPLVEEFPTDTRLKQRVDALKVP